MHSIEERQTQALQEAVSSHYWEAIHDHMLERANGIMVKLKCCTPEELPRLQGQLNMLETLMALPETLKSRRKAKGDAR